MGRRLSRWVDRGAAPAAVRLLLAGCIGCAIAVSRMAADAPPQRGPTVGGAQPAVVSASADDFASIAGGFGASAREQRDVRAFYLQRAGQQAWVSSAGTLEGPARAVLERLRDAATHGLSPGDYASPVLDGAPARAATPLAQDAALTLMALRYMRHLHLGRVDPRSLGLRIETWSEVHDFPTLLAGSVAQNRVAEALDALAPPFALYRRLRRELGRYRELAAAGDVPPVPMVVRSVHPGDPYTSTGVLAARLLQLGDLAASESLGAGGRYEGAVVAGVARFQARHGLTSDGVLGARTVAALRVPLSQRVLQIVMALERLRWLPDLGRRRLVSVNIPMFRLWAWDALAGSAEPALSLQVIVGKAVRRTKTPIFVETMDHVIFRPYWNVPTSILHDETLPRILRDPGYLAREQMEIVAGPGDDARLVPATPEAIDRLSAGELRLRQRPGSHNALGLVKFVFPNNEGVYMHGTPTPDLFARDRRDFSHGCIRVSDPPALAAWALRRESGWDAGRIAAAMAADSSERVDLREPIDVVLYYLTAAVLPEDGRIHFADDIYGHDAVLARALARLGARG